MKHQRRIGFLTLYVNETIGNTKHNKKIRPKNILKSF